MMVMSFPKAIILASLLGLLAACESAEERAETYYQNGIALLESGDVDRALIEFRNVLAIDEFNREARAIYAKIERGRGNIPEAYAHFLRLAEANPDDMKSRLALAEMAIGARNWQEVDRHADALKQAGSTLPGADVVDLVQRFRKALLDEDDAAVARLTDEAAELAKTNPENINLIRALIEG